jgi:hypothetical protein
MNIQFLKVEGGDGLVRDPNTHAILNTNNKEYETYIARKNAVQAQKVLIEKQGKEIKDLKNDISEIKQMLSILINKQ